jgi:hypothetical protein
MAILRAKARNRLPKSSFGLPGQRKYPMPDKSHAKDALARASEEKNKGNLSLAQAQKIRAKAYRKLGKSP